jgi:serine/threonine protein kinase
VMQFVDGVTLRSAMRAGPMALSRIASLISQTAEALTAAHDQGSATTQPLKPLPTGITGWRRATVSDLRTAAESSR